MIKTREDLILLLNEAAELEHLLAVQYLYAAFATKRLPEEGLPPKQQNAVYDWSQLILLISRQEMEHLGLVNNILTSIGGMPHFERPNFPLSGKYFTCPMFLEKLNDRSIKRFICFERPDEISKEDAFCKAYEHHDLSRTDPKNPLYYKDVAELYKIIAKGISNIDMTDEELFIGPPEAQLGGETLSLSFSRVGASGGVFDMTFMPITDRVTALKAIDLITEQGEGTPGPFHTEPSHYQRFLDILKQFSKIKREDPSFDPSRNVVANPVLWEPEYGDGYNIITHPLTRQVMELFNNSYMLMMQMMIRFFAHTDETQAELNVLKYAAFFPFMTIVIRPMGELLTEMPAFEDDEDGPRAGASFEINSALEFLPHKKAAWKMFEERLLYLSQQMETLSKQDGVPDRLAYVGESIGFIAQKFQLELVDEQISKHANKNNT